MDAQVWKQCVTNWKSTLKQFKKKGADVRKLRVLKPVPGGQILEFEETTGLKLPADFKALMGVSGGVEFAWWLLVKNTTDYLKPPVRFAEYGGNFEYEFIGASRDQTLLDLYAEFQENYEGFSVDDSQQVELIRRCFPLYRNDGDGNALALRLDTDPAEVHCLKGEYGWHLFEEARSAIDRSLVGIGLTDFMLRWSAIGSPATNSILEALAACGGEQIDPESQAAQTWLGWLADPNAKETSA